MNRAAAVNTLKNTAKKKSIIASKNCKTSLSPFICSPARVFLDQQGGFIGSRYKKVVYRQFTNDKFTTQVARAADMEHLGVMGELSMQQKSTSFDYTEKPLVTLCPKHSGFICVWPSLMFNLTDLGH